MKWICSFKAYGDMVIACNVLRHTNNGEYGLLAGSHLIPLLKAIEYNNTVLTINIGNSVPAVFDVRKSGYLKAIYSAIQLRRAVENSLITYKDVLIFDAISRRQKFIASRYKIDCIASDTGNIYTDYFNYLNIPSKTHFEYDAHPRTGDIVIFPDSRIKEKELPLGLVNKIIHENNKVGLTTKIIRCGQKPLNPCQSETEPIIDWINGFDILASTIRNAKAIISADSLPGHISEYFNKPIFVFTPTNNKYWMPLSCYIQNHYSMFNITTTYLDWINQIKNQQSCMFH